MSENSIQYHYAKIIELLGEDLNREGLKKTPERVEKAMRFLCSGYEEENPEEIILSAKFKEEYKEMVVVKDIDFYSMCEHHLLPFFGKVHIAYYPNGFVTGLSKIPRVVDVFSRRLQLQERLTTDIASCIENALKPKGVAVCIEASHLCMEMRGVSKQRALTQTFAFSGEFEKAEQRALFLENIKK